MQPKHEIISKTSKQTKLADAQFVKIPGAEGFYAFKVKQTVLGPRGRAHSEVTTQGITKSPKLHKGVPTSVKTNQRGRWS